MQENRSSTDLGDTLLFNADDDTPDVFGWSLAGMVTMTEHTDSSLSVRLGTTGNRTGQGEPTATDGTEGLSIPLMPAVMLWLPHASITLLLILLVVVSFVRFHCKYGHKYRKPTSPPTVSIHWDICSGYRRPTIAHTVSDTETLVTRTVNQTHHLQSVYVGIFVTITVNLPEHLR